MCRVSAAAATTVKKGAAGRTRAFCDVVVDISVSMILSENRFLLFGIMLESKEAAQGRPLVFPASRIA
jgi:hypothetical protein